MKKYARLQKTTCTKCGTENKLITRAKSFKCTNCGSYLDWTPRITCNNCGTENRISTEEIETHKCITYDCQHPIKWSVDPSLYTPNEVPLEKRTQSVLFTVFIFALSTYATVKKEITLLYCSRYNGCSKYYFEGLEILMPLLAAIMAAAYLIVIVIDHYDTRHNEMLYKRSTFWLRNGAIFLYAISLFWGHKIQ